MDEKDSTAAASTQAPVVETEYPGGEQEDRDGNNRPTATGSPTSTQYDSSAAAAAAGHNAPEGSQPTQSEELQVRTVPPLPPPTRRRLLRHDDDDDDDPPTTLQTVEGRRLGVDDSAVVPGLAGDTDGDGDTPSPHMDPVTAASSSKAPAPQVSKTSSLEGGGVGRRPGEEVGRTAGSRDSRDVAGDTVPGARFRYDDGGGNGGGGSDGAFGLSGAGSAGKNESTVSLPIEVRIGFGDAGYDRGI